MTGDDNIMLAGSVFNNKCFSNSNNNDIYLQNIKPDVSMTLNGSLAGLVAQVVINPVGACIIGIALV
ncbi:MAG: hypothetical protein ACLS23_07930 [Clostridioides difficile]